MPYQDDLRRYFGEIARYAEPALTAGSAMVAEPVSGLAGLGALLRGRGVDGAVQSINAAQQEMTYQPRTVEGQQGLQGLQAFLQPVGEVIQGASQNLGDKAYSATGSPALAAAAYSAPTAFLEGLGLKGLNIARKPVSGADLYSARMGVGAVGDGGNIVRLYHGAPVEFDEFDPARVGDRLTSLGLGHYLTPNKEMAKQYGENVMEFDVDLSNMLDWQNLTPAQRTQIETALMNSIPESRISHFGERKYEILPRGKEGAARFKELKELTKDAYNDYAKARILDDADIEEIDPSLFDRLGKDDVVVGWREGGDLSSANSQQLMTLMNEFSPELAKQLGYKASKFSDQIAIYDPKLAKRVKDEKPDQPSKMSAGAVGGISDNYKASGVESSISERPSEIVLNKIVVPKEKRGTGIGSDFMMDLTRYADSKGKTISLTPSADFGGNKSRLTEFYKRFGFVENKGKNKDYEISEAMYRPAKKDEK